LCPAEAPEARSGRRRTQDDNFARYRIKGGVSRGLLEALVQRRMMRLTAHRDRRLDARLFASLDIGRAEIACVRQQIFGLAQGQCP